MYLITCYSCNTPEHSLCHTIPCIITSAYYSMFCWKVINLNLIKVNTFTEHVAFFFSWKSKYGGLIFFLCTIHYLICNCHVPSYFFLSLNITALVILLFHSQIFPRLWSFFPLVFGLLQFLFFQIGQPELKKALKGEQTITAHKHTVSCLQVHIKTNSSFYLMKIN